MRQLLLGIYSFPISSVRKIKRISILLSRSDNARSGCANGKGRLKIGFFLRNLYNFSKTNTLINVQFLTL